MLSKDEMSKINELLYSSKLTSKKISKKAGVSHLTVLKYRMAMGTVSSTNTEAGHGEEGDASVLDPYGELISQRLLDDQSQMVTPSDGLAAR